MTDLKVLVIGQGGREHALVKALKESPSVREVHCAPGNPGIALEALCHPLELTGSQVGELCRRLGLSLVVIGPEVPLANGLADELRQQGFMVFGPSQMAAQLEASKLFAKKFMLSAGVHTAPYVEVRSVEQVQQSLHLFTPPYVLKADGLAAGKGVFLCETPEDLILAAQKLFEEKILGPAGQVALLEQYQSGWELSYLILTHGQSYQALPLAQDHKRLKAGDLGPNTGGMGAIAPLLISADLDQSLRTKVLDPIVQQLKNAGMNYKGILYVGLMITPLGPSVLEFNVRFGDPEAQVVLPLLDGDWGLVMQAVAHGELPILHWKPLHVACVVMAAPGYPDLPQKGVPLQGNVQFQTSSSYFLHAGTDRPSSNSPWLTGGGRVLNAVGIGNTREEALKNAYYQSSQVIWEGMIMRDDIGKTASTISAISTIQ